MNPCVLAPFDGRDTISSDLAPFRIVYRPITLSLADETLAGPISHRSADVMRVFISQVGSRGKKDFEFDEVFRPLPCPVLHRLADEEHQ